MSDIIPGEVHGFPVNTEVVRKLATYVPPLGYYGEDIPPSYTWLHLLFAAPARCVFLVLSGEIGDGQHVGVVYEHDGRYLVHERHQGSCAGCDDFLTMLTNLARTLQTSVFARLRQAATLEEARAMVFADLPNNGTEWHRLIDVYGWTVCESYGEPVCEDGCEYTPCLTVDEMAENTRPFTHKKK